MRLFFILCLLLSSVAYGQNTNPKTPVDSRRAELYSALDMKVFHDPIIMKQILKQMQNASTTEYDTGTTAVFDQKDSKTIEDQMAQMPVGVKLNQQQWEDLHKKAETNPFGAFIDVLEAQQRPSISKEQIKQLNTVDKTAIPKLMETAAGAGPEIGAGMVSFTH